METTTRTSARDLLPGDVIEFKTHLQTAVFTVVQVEDLGNQEAALVLRRGRGEPKRFRTFIDSRFDKRV